VENKATGPSPQPEEGAINQMILPMLPAGATPINAEVGVINDGSHWNYFVGLRPVYRHPVGSVRCFQLTIAQLVDSGTCRPVEILKAFGIAKSNLDRTLRKYRSEGIEAFFKRKTRVRQGRVLTAQVLAQAQGLLDEGQPKAAVAQQLAVPLDTLRRAVWDGRLRAKKPDQSGTLDRTGSDKSQRSVQDAQAAEGMGTACTRVEERMLAALGALDGAAIRFEAARQVPFGGVLCALGALLANGLLSPAREFLGKISGYYSATHILLLLGFMSLCRIKTTERLRGKAPGELGKLMGLDRVPEVRCLRQKLDEMSADEASEKWAAALSRQWMEANPEATGRLYVDGHVRVYHGGKTKLPRKYVSRERLCLRGTTDYWVNDASGRPFFVIDKVVDSGLLEALRQDIVPRLLREVPGQPNAEELAADPYQCRFVLVFDRQGYSPAFFKEMWQQHRIACLTYHKYPGNDWAAQEFASCQVGLSNGETIAMDLAERASLVGSGADKLWVKEVRKRTESGHQIALVGTAYRLEAGPLAGGLFSRWCQENFFRYMMEHFAIDLLAEYGTEPLHDTTKVVNPAWRQLDSQCRSLATKLRYRRARFAALELAAIAPEEAKKLCRREQQMAAVLEEVTVMEEQLAAFKAQKKQTVHHISWIELPDQERFEKPLLGRKRLLDAVRMIAYRAETALCALIRSPSIDLAAARRLLQDLFVNEADLLPDPVNKRLLVSIHRGSRPAVDRDIAALLKILNEAETTFPGTDLILHLRLLGQPAPECSSTSISCESQR
jgi:hypothetical protein